MKRELSEIDKSLKEMVEIHQRLNLLKMYLFSKSYLYYTQERADIANTIGRKRK